MIFQRNLISKYEQHWGVMVIVVVLSEVDHGFKNRSGQTKCYKIGIWCFFAKHASLRRKSKDWLVWNHDNVSEWGDMSTCGLLLQRASAIKIKIIVLVYKKTDLIIISFKIKLFSS